MGSIVRDENSVLTVSSLIDDYYSITDVCLSIPTLLNVNGISKHIPIDLDETERDRLRNCADTIKEIVGKVEPRKGPRFK